MDTFNQFFSNVKTDDRVELNNELDDMALPEDVVMPPIEEIKKTIATVDTLEKAAASATTPKAPTLPRVNTNVSTVDPGDHSPTVDMLSVTSEMNRNSHVLQELMTDMSILKGQVTVLPTLDARLAKLEKMLVESASKIAAFSDSLTNNQQSMSRFQSDMARKISDVERRAALPKAPVGFNTSSPTIVPSQVSHTAPGYVAPAADPLTLDPKKVTVVDMSNW
jgi:uncharacterized coiled-coil protein SlyX